MEGRISPTISFARSRVRSGRARDSNMSKKQGQSPHALSVSPRRHVDGTLRLSSSPRLVLVWVLTASFAFSDTCSS